jgi:predicted negative regulator of RcsB-dependent stress response
MRFASIICAAISRPRGGWPARPSELARHNRYAYYAALGKCHIGWVTGMEGDIDDGIATLTEGLSELRRTGTSLPLPGLYVLLAQLYVRAGQLDEAKLTLAMATGEKESPVWAADIERVRGDVIAVDWAAAEAAYRSSLAIARRQGAGLFMCKAGLSLAHLCNRAAGEERATSC